MVTTDQDIFLGLIVLLFASDSGSEGAQDTRSRSCVCILLFSSIACGSDSGSEGAQDTGLVVVCVFCCFPVLPVPVTQVQKALRTRVS